MQNIYSTLISVPALEQLLAEDEPLLLDCRHQLGDPDWGYSQYLTGHIASARHADMDRDLAGTPGSRGRHPLPELASWVETLVAWGLDFDQQVVVYDDAGGAFAARAWWMLRWAGHEAVAVLDGGLAHWRQPLISGPAPATEPGSFILQPALTRTVSLAAVESTVEKPTMSLLDARTQARWAGEEEPIDPIAGHIPTSACYPLKDNLNPGGTFKSATELAERFAELPDPITCYCGSGVTACHNVLALKIAGREAGLFVDSWSGWISDPQHPVGRAEPSV